MSHLDKIKKALPEQFAQHTQGPWEIVKEEITQQCDIVKNGEYIAENIDQRNAKLIAAAPDLLEALQSVLPFIKIADIEVETGIGMFREGATLQLINKVESAIKKATT